MSEATEVFSVRELFEAGPYTVPVYQRAYAWREDEILQLLRDVRDARLRQLDHPDSTSDYYIGTLVVHQPTDIGSHSYEVVDGQQRLTTLALVLSHPAAVASTVDGTSPPRAASCLEFEGRPRSQGDLAQIVEYPEDIFGDAPPREPHDDGIRNAVTVISRALDARSAHGRGEATFEEADIRFLLDRVHIVRTKLPAGTDLNHYFEIMNSRGEQLEKHEIVKAHLIGQAGLTESERSALSTIWDACSDLSRYVQQGFDKALRQPLFGRGWDRLTFSSADEIFSLAGTNNPDEGGHERATLGSLLDAGSIPAETEPDEEAGRYGAIIDFPNLLLQTLKLYLIDQDRQADGHAWRFTWADTDGKVPLDDKRLIGQFKEHIHSAQDARGFIHTLLVARFLFDNYVIKTDQVRDTTEDGSNWVLKRPHRTGHGSQSKLSPRDTFGEHTLAQDDADIAPGGAQRRLLLVQSMFQVTDSRRAYKNFLFATLDVLWRTHRRGLIANGDELAAALEQLARDRVTYLLRPDQTSESDVVDTGTAVPQFIFNYLDYALWRGLETGNLEYAGIDHESFRFRYRKSIEHFYPVQPNERDGHPQLAAETVNQFGNLCVMTPTENSRRNNLAAKAKAEQFRADTESLKFQIMAAMTKYEQSWGSDQIRQHGDEMRDLLRSPLP